MKWSAAWLWAYLWDLKRKAQVWWHYRYLH